MAVVARMTQGQNLGWLDKNIQMCVSKIQMLEQLEEPYEKQQDDGSGQIDGVALQGTVRHRLDRFGSQLISSSHAAFKPLELELSLHTTRNYYSVQ